MSFWKKLVSKFIPTTEGAIVEETERDVDWEAMLLEADLGIDLAERLHGILKSEKLDKKPRLAEERLKKELEQLLIAPPYRLIMDKPEVILLVGVNGSGKTTSAAKLAQRITKQGRKVMFGAADTFRAGAVDQLQVWGDRLNIPVVSGPPGRDPASVAFESYEKAVTDALDVLIVDTAGRMPNKNNLMQEIAKVKRILQKKNPESPHHVWLVVDGTTGMNVLIQAREFHAAVGLTGMIMTKLDSSAKGGMIAAVRAELGVPTLFLGRGEKTEDLQEFDSIAFVKEFFG